MGASINSTVPIDSGGSVALSEDGTILAIGSTQEFEFMVFSSTQKPSSQSYNGSLRVYKLNATIDDWTQMGGSIEVTTDNGEDFGASVSLSADGLTVAVGAPSSDLYGRDKGLP